MPLYEISHICPLSEVQQDELAAAFTDIHSAKFTTPRMFVQVKFTNARDTNTYIAGRRKKGNHIVAHVRVGPSRSQADFNSLCEEIVAAWKRIAPLPRAKGKPEEDYELRSCIVMGGLTAGWEAGFILPGAGGDVGWLREHWEEFERRAEGGDDEFAELVREVKERGLLEDQETKHKRRLEEMLGWGDSA